MFRTIINLIIVSVGLLALLSGASVLGSIWERADVLSHLRLHIALLLGLCSIALFISKERTIAILAMFVAAFNIFATLHYPHRVIENARTGQDLKVLSLNTLHWAKNTETILDLVRDEQPDIIFLQEIEDPKSRVLLAKLKEDYPWQETCGPKFYCDTAILSRYEWLESGSGNYGYHYASASWARFGPAFRNATLASVHLRWPFFTKQKEQLRAIYTVLRKNDGPVMLAGDFNATPWSWLIRSFAKTENIRPAGHFLPTWPATTFTKRISCEWCFPQIQIDQVMISDDIRLLDIRTGRSVASDHLPIISRIQIPTVKTASK